MEKILDLFSGPRGWGEGLRQLGEEDVLGVEIDKHAVHTAELNSHKTVQADVSQMDPTDFSGISGLIASPPCQAFSTAASGPKEYHDSAKVLELVTLMSQGGDHDHTFTSWDNEGSHLAAQPMRYIVALEPEWIAMEEVITVQPLWDHYARILRSMGYFAWTGYVNAEQYGVPQTRKRSILLAHKTKRPMKPKPTHSKFHVKSPDRLDGGVLPWVSIKDHLIEENLWDEGMADYKYWLRATRRNSAAVRTNEQPYPTVIGKNTSSALWFPKWEDPMPKQSVQAWMVPDEATQVSAHEAAAIQTFPADYHFAGPMTEQYIQIGNAVPPRLAAALLRQFIKEEE